MKNLKLILAMFLVLALAGSAFGAPILNVAGDGIEDINGEAFSTYINSGVHLGNHSIEPTLANIIDLLDPNYDYTAGKVEYEDDEFSQEDPNDWFMATAVDGGQSGTWYTTDTPPSQISYYTVFAANNLALYLVDPAEASGSWSTYHLFIAGHEGATLEISNIVGVRKPGVSVPEPATMLLLGTSLFGLALVRRRFKK